MEECLAYGGPCCPWAGDPELYKEVVEHARGNKPESNISSMLQAPASVSLDDGL